jgi:hypothetical protein
MKGSHKILATRQKFQKIEFMWNGKIKLGLEWEIGNKACLNLAYSVDDISVLMFPASQSSEENS